jgi:hypothetical protein
MNEPMMNDILAVVRRPAQDRLGVIGYSPGRSSSPSRYRPFHRYRATARARSTVAPRISMVA